MAKYNKPISEYGYEESVLIIATPRNCGECWLRVKTEDMPDGEVWCPLINQLMDEQERDEGCMLRPEPQKKNIDCVSTKEFFERIGWNACLDALEGKE